MQPNRPTLTPPWMPVGLSTLVLLGLVVVLNQRAPTPLLSRQASGVQPSSVTVTSIHFITKIEWRQRPFSVTTTSTPASSAGKWPNISASLDTGLVASGTVSQEIWNQDLIPVLSGATYMVSMNPSGPLRLECTGGSTEVGLQFSVPLNANSCVLQITGAAGTPWSVRRTA